MSDNLEIRRKCLRYRSWHRGVKELDLLLGRFADARLGAMSPAQLDRFEALLEVPEPVIGGWLLGGQTPPLEFDNDVLRDLLVFPFEPGPH